MHFDGERVTILARPELRDDRGVRNAEMIKFLAHLHSCPICSSWPRTPCSKGYDLWERGAERLVRKYDPQRAVA